MKWCAWCAAGPDARDAVSRERAPRDRAAPYVRAGPAYRRSVAAWEEDVTRVLTDSPLITAGRESAVQRGRRPYHTSAWPAPALVRSCQSLMPCPLEHPLRGRLGASVRQSQALR